MDSFPNGPPKSIHFIVHEILTHPYEGPRKQNAASLYGKCFLNFILDYHQVKYGLFYIYLAYHPIKVQDISRYVRVLALFV